jgi:uncharacterized membrane protein YfcA
MIPEFLIETSVMAVAVLIGAMVQGSTGFGIGLVATPIIALVDPTLLPAALIIVSVPLPLMTGLREFRSVRFGWLGWSLAGRVPGNVAGAFAAAWFSPRLLGLTVGFAVLAAVAASIARWAPRITRVNLVLAGALSGASGTATSIGSPPVALLMQRQRGPEVRATLSLFFFVGATLSVAFLALGGLITLRHVMWAAGLAVPMLIGFWLSGPARRFVDRGRVKLCVLVLVTASAIALIVTSW